MSATRSLRASDRGERVAKVLYIHGLEAGPQGKKVNALRRHFDVQAVQMKTPSFAEIASPGYRQSPEFEKVFRACVQLQLTALSEFRPDVIVASSFGAAVCLDLIRERHWCGPTVLIAPAPLGLAKEQAATEPGLQGVPGPVLILHGARDKLIPLSASEKLASTGASGHVALKVLDDEHEMNATLAKEDGLAAYVEALLDSVEERVRRPEARLAVIRRVSASECPWLSASLPPYSTVYTWSGATYGVLSADGLPVTFRPREPPFFELPEGSVTAALDRDADVPGALRARL
eukprot:TRINITY_DN34330_c0_g1_i1.p1 TRINITY_DN34330_c0_g1~~TRINITY_DN34330_c0_g1_i1.p1  ORF type:complete len:307 (-),score=62.70 TRINITY_DN34330_c0_g1_i1:619-1488(-)